MAALLVLIPILALVVLNLPLGKLGSVAALPFAILYCLAEAFASVAMPDAFWAGAPAPQLARQLGNALGTFPVDAFVRVMFFCIALVGLCTALVARYHRSAEETELRFANLLLLILAGMNGIVLVHDLFALYVFLEVTSVCSLILIVVEKGREAFEGAFKYMVLGAVATSLMLAGLALLFTLSGSTSFEVVRASLAGVRAAPLTLVAVAFFVVGLSIKAGLVPFHGWLPDAYSAAPAPVSVLLAGIVTKTTGVYTLIRVVHEVLGNEGRIGPMLLAVATASILVGALAALGQRDLKRMLAYSSISQVGYIVLGLAVGTPLALLGAVLHLLNHAIFKTLLFVNSAAVEKQAGTRDMNQLGGISARMPVTGTTSVIALLSTAGIPPFSGFWSKLIIIIGVWKAGEHGYAAAAVLASVLTLAYFLSMQRRVFFGKLAESCASLKEAGFWALVPALLLTALTVGLGVSAPWLLPWVFQAFHVPQIGSIL